MYVVVLPPVFELFGDEVAEFVPGDGLQFLEGLLEHLGQFGLHFACLFVDLADLPAHLVQQLLQLVLPLLQIRVHLVYFGRYLREVVAYFLQGVLRQRTLRVLTVYLAADTHTFVALSAEKLVFALLVVFADAEV